MGNPVLKVTVPSVQAMKREKRKIVALTCYDFTTAQLLNAAGVDILLVGDSLGMVKLGYPTTLPVTVEDMLYHTRIVAKGLADSRLSAGRQALLVTDMPYLSYQVSPKQAVENCGRMMKAGAAGVKIEGGHEILPEVEALRRAKIPVMGHLGMTPQSVNVFGGYKVQARERAAAKQLLADARALERAGVFSIVLECVPEAVARAVTQALAIPTIGIGAGAHCDGQVLVIDDLLGLTADPLPRFVKRYAQLRQTIQQAAIQYGRDVRSGKFPDSAHSYP
jgi:3-methyl-2-oxobutanoate hydroxymethyltransferase